MKLLDSGNSLYSHRHSALQAFNQIFKSPKLIFEFYVNYDCDVNSENLFEKITDALARITQGKYSKSTFSLGMQPAQDLALRTMALETLLEILKLINKSIEENEKNENLETEENNLKEETMKDIMEEEEKSQKVDNYETFFIKKRGDF